MHDTTLQAISVGVFDVEEGDELATLAVVTGLGLPLANPQTGEQVIVPDAQYRVPLQKSAVGALIEGLQKAYDSLPEPKRPSGIVVPGSPADVDRVVNDLGKLK